jgi:hypothetical protein
MNTTTKPKFNSALSQPSFNYEAHVTELKERFARLIKQLGANNKKGSDRYQFEVDFSYAMYDVETAPPYLQGKMFDQASSVVSALINYLKRNEGQVEEA